MITVLLTPTDSAAELDREYKRWTAAFKRKPDVIVAHKNLPYSLVDNEHATWNTEQTKVRFRGVLVVALDEFFDLHAEDLGHGRRSSDVDDAADDDETDEEDF